MNIVGFLFFISIIQSNLSYADTCYGCNFPTLNSTDLKEAQKKIIQEQERIKQEQERQNIIIVTSIVLLAIGSVVVAFFIRKKIRSKNGLK